MSETQPSGFLEISHTADWALKVWAPDLPGLLAQAAKGMYALMEVKLQPGAHMDCPMDLDAADAEGLLVAFLSELLYLDEQEGLGFDDFDLVIQGCHLSGTLQGAPVESQRKEIKAVTYHNLEILEIYLPGEPTPACKTRWRKFYWKQPRKAVCFFKTLLPSAWWLIRMCP